MFTSFNVSRQSKRISLTLLVGFVFFWFWLQGPLNRTHTILNLVSNDSEFLIPILIGSNKQLIQKEFGLIAEKTISISAPYGLIKKRSIKTHGLIADSNHQPSMIQQVGTDMLLHAGLFYPQQNATLKTALDLFYIELSKGKKVVSELYLESTGLSEDIKGYAGPITLGMTVSLQGKIKEVRYLGSQETSSYLQKITDAGFYQQFSNIPLTNEQHQVDAVSGATITTQAMARTITRLLDKAGKSPLALYLSEDSAGMSVIAELSDEWIIQIILIALFFLYFWQPWIRRTRSSNSFIFISSSFYIGFYLNNSFSAISLLHPFLGVSLSWVVAFYCALVLLGSIWDNNTYCKFVCPYGNVQRILTRFTPSFRNPFFISAPWVKRIRTLLTVTIFLGFILGKTTWASYELFPDLFGLNIDSVWFFIAISSIGITAIYPMIWCRLLCPTGEILDWISNIVTTSKKKRVTEVKDKSINCSHCDNNGCNRGG